MKKPNGKNVAQIAKAVPVAGVWLETLGQFIGLTGKTWTRFGNCIWVEVEQL